MSSQWTNKYAIMRDLSLAQGFELPINLSDTVAPGEKPPTLILTEENEHFYNHNGEDGDGNTVPDLTLIQHMLKMIHPESDSEDDSKLLQGVNGPSNSVIEIAKPAPMVKEQSKSKVESVSNKEPAIKKKAPAKNVKKKRINVAVDSILLGLEKSKQTNQPAPEIKFEPKFEITKLLKPTDFMATRDTVESESLNIMLDSLKDNTAMESSIGKVNDWLSQSCDYVTITNSADSVNSLSNSSAEKSKTLIDFEPRSMFKKKKVVQKQVEISKVETSPVKKDDPIANYKPTELADEYYKKYLDHIKFKESVKEDIWTKAERMMKEIDVKKVIEATEIAVIQPQLDAGVTSRDAIFLPQHRHLLTGSCVVCEVVKKNGIDIDLAILQNNECDNKLLFDKLKVVERGKECN